MQQSEGTKPIHLEVQIFISFEDKNVALCENKGQLSFLRNVKWPNKNPNDFCDTSPILKLIPVPSSTSFP